MAVIGELLFYRRDQRDLDSVLRWKIESLQQVVDGLPELIFKDKSDEEIATLIQTQESIVPLQLDFDAATPSVRETQVEVSDYFSKGAVRVAGLEGKKAVPFTGDAGLWDLRPNPYDMNPPRGEVRPEQLIVGIAVRESESEQVAAYLSEVLARVETYIERQTSQIERHNESISRHAAQWIIARRQRISKASELLKSLGG